MPKIVSKALQVRLAFAAQEGRTVTQSEVADTIGIMRLTLRRIERGETQGIDFDILAKLCAYYGVQVGDMLEFSPEDASSPTPMMKA